MFAEAGFENVKIDIKEQSKEIIGSWMPGSNAEDYVASAYVTANKPMSVTPTTLPQDNVFAPVKTQPVPIVVEEDDAACCPPTSAAKDDEGCCPPTAKETKNKPRPAA